MDAAEPPSWTCVEPGLWDRRVLNQGTWWVDRQARVWRLTEMSEAHLFGVLGMLGGQARALHMHAMVDALLLGITDPDTLIGEALAHDAGASLAEATPEGYFEATPLVRAIRRELHTRRT